MHECGIEVSKSTQMQGDARACNTYLIRHKAHRKVACGAPWDFAGMLALNCAVGTGTRAFAATTVNIGIAAV